jgi:hypothetical protein
VIDIAQEFRQPSTDKRPITFDWTQWLIAQNNDTIASSTFTYQAINSTDTSLNISTPIPGYTATTTRVWISGGLTGQIYYVYNTINTVAGLTRTKVLKVTIQNETP